MEVILVKPVRKLGKVGETVKIKRGYGRNFLLPQGFAIRATRENVERFSSVREELESKNSQEKIKMQEVAKSLDGKHLNFVMQSSADGKLFGSISSRALASSISKLTGHKLNYSNIIIDEPIKFNGVFEVQVMLHPEIFASVLVVVAKSELEAQNYLQEYQAKKAENNKKNSKAKEEEVDSKNDNKYEDQSKKADK